MVGQLGANFTPGAQNGDPSAPGSNSANGVSNGGIGNNVPLVGNTVKSASGTLFGNSTQPGLLGTGMYTAPQYNINPAAFQSSAGNQGANWNNAMAGMLGQTTGAAPQLGPTAQSYGPNAAQFGAAYGGLTGLAAQYGNMAAGNGPSLAATTAAQQANSNYAQQLGMLGMGGGNPAMAKYQAGQALGQAQAANSQQAVMGRTQEEMSALGAQGNILGQQAGMGLNTGQFNAGQLNQTNLAQGQLQAGQNALNANQYNQYVQNLGQVNSQNLQASIAQQQLGEQQQVSLDQINANAYNNAAKNNGSLFGSILGAAGSLAA